MKRSFSLLCALLFSFQSARAWDAEGHKAIAEAAGGMLTPGARAKVEAISGKASLATVATWLDDVRNAKKHHVGPLKDDPEAAEFNSRFPDNGTWHYVNLPVGVSAYTLSGPFSSKDDIVHAIRRCVDVLEGKASSMTPLQALRVLVHLVGDIHQPMHTISGYYDLQDLDHPKLIGNALAAVGKPDDRGGNQLFYTKSLELHAYWDKKMPQKVQRTQPTETLAKILASGGAPDKWLTAGQIRQWPAKWVKETAMAAGKAYQGITFGQATIAADGSLERIEITLPERYDEIQTDRAKTQLTKAACHLAQLLNGIQFP